ncbi:uncharacterized protein A4U43_C07F15760 [Asparagus officinalis]|uniref:Uncharacterized protein n=1 Tax=Asparagus officinalis TaxID=4686 RepID=A0A5P1EE85_ASPOF|nr:uncharacterized protein A4U43_C07F15760 [Asparagus officinalis]
MGRGHRGETGFFHRKHFRVPKGVVTTSYTCNRCKDAKTMSGKDKQRKTEKSKEDTTNVKTKEENINSMNLMDREISTVNVTAWGKRSVMLKKEIKSKIVGDKDKKSMKVEESCRRSERVRQKSIGNGKLKSQGHKKVSKKRKISEGKAVEAKEDKGKHVVTKIKIKFNGPKRSEEGISERTRAKIKFNGPKRSKENKSESAKSEKYENGISWRKRKRSVVRFSYWLNGLLWTHKAVTEGQSDFKERNVILPFQQDLITTPCCCLCHQEYNSGVIYISCERCQGWFHGDIFGLAVENINHLIGFLCHKCRMRDEPVCPFSDGTIGGAELDRKYEIGMNVMGNEGQNDVDQQYGDPVLCKDGYLDEDCLARVQSKDRFDKLQRENVPEEELCLSSNSKLTNGHLAHLQQKNNFGEFRNCVRESCPSIVQSQDHMDEKRREDVTLHEEEPSSCPKSVSENLDNVQLPQVEEAYISSTKKESVVEVGVALPEAREELYGMIEIPDPGIEVGIHSDSIKFDPQITLPALNLDDADRVTG